MDGYVEAFFLLHSSFYTSFPLHAHLTSISPPTLFDFNFPKPNPPLPSNITPYSLLLHFPSASPSGWKLALQPWCLSFGFTLNNHAQWEIRISASCSSEPNPTIACLAPLCGYTSPSVEIINRFSCRSRRKPPLCKTHRFCGGLCLCRSFSFLYSYTLFNGGDSFYPSQTFISD